MFQASQYQEAIFKAVQEAKRDIVVSAVAGSGKSTTLQHLLDYIPATKSVLYCCFNADASKSLQAKINEYSATKMQEGQSVPNATCSTIHSLGNSTLALNGMRSQIKNNKYSSLVRQYLNEHMETYDSQLAQNISKLVDMVRLTLTPATEEGLMYVINRFDIDINPYDKEQWPLVKRCVPEVLKAGIKVAKEAKEIDFTDMIWLPSSQALNLTPKQYDWVLVDEAQDLSPAQRELVLKARRSNGRFIAVGDRSQAIYGFAGASLRSIDEIIEATGAIEMPLSICYRCPKSVIAEANKIYPGTEAAPDAEEGIVDYITTDKVSDMVTAGDLILCRLTAPLVSKCLELLREGKRANVRGKDLGSQFTSLLTAMEKKYRQHMHIDTIIEVAQEYERWQISLLSLNAEDNEMKIASLQDKIDTLIALYEAYKARQNGSSTLEGFKQYIEAFFAEDKDAQIILSTGHRAKGLEYKRVYILDWDKLPHPKAKTVDQLIQEHNLMYVMITRAQEALFLVQNYVRTLMEPETLPAIEEEQEKEPVTISEEIPTMVASVAETVIEAPITPEPTVDTPEPVEASQSVVETFTVTLKKIQRGHKAKKENKAHRHMILEEQVEANMKALVAQGIDVSALANDLLKEYFRQHPIDNNPPDDTENKEKQGKPEISEEVQDMPEETPEPATRDDVIRRNPYQYSIMSTLRTAYDEMGKESEESEEGETLTLQSECQIVRQFYTCLSKRCKHHWGADYHIDEHGTLYRFDENNNRITEHDDSAKCPKCGNKAWYIKKHRMQATYSKGHKCDARCWNAKSPTCVCACGGINHGKNNMVGTALFINPQNDKALV